MIGGPNSPALTSALSLCLSAVAVVSVGGFFSPALWPGSIVALVVGTVFAFLAIAAGIVSFYAPEPGLTFALLGIGLSLGVIVLVFLVFLLKMAYS